MNGNGLSAGDILALTKGSDGSNFLEGNGILIILFFLILIGGFGNFGGNNGIQNAFENQNVINKLDTMSTGLGQATWNINSAIMGAEASLQKCCCDTNRNIDQLRFDNERTGAMVANAIHQDGEATRRLINDAITQHLRDELDQARGVISNANQSRYILDRLGSYYTNPPCYSTNPCANSCGNLYA